MSQNSCPHCGITSFVYDRSGHSEVPCFECRQLMEDPGKVMHHERLRCPHCEEICNPYDLKSPHLAMQSGTGEATCPACTKPFTFEVGIVYQFYSPPVEQPKSPRRPGGEVCQPPT